MVFSIGGAISALFLYHCGQRLLVGFKLNKVGRNIYNFFNRKWFFDKIYNEWITQSALNFGYHTSFKTIDRGLIEMFGPYGVSFLIYSRSLYLKSYKQAFYTITLFLC